uniref:SET domain-containing protein n=1 Tax=Caenorhabditis tropicalis TaxID=1561998 RepID=A0A1I7TE07_9PELO
MVSHLRTRSKANRKCKKVETKIVKIHKISKKALELQKKNKKIALEKLLDKDPKALSSKERLSLALRIKNTFKSRSIPRQMKKKNSSSSDSESSSVEEETVVSSGDRVSTRAQASEMMRKFEETKKETVGVAPKISEIRKNVKVVEWDEMKQLVLSEKMLRSSIGTDPCLMGYYERVFKETIEKEDMNRIATLSFAHFRRESDCGKSETGNAPVEFSDELVKSMNNGKYVPPKKRLLLIKGRSDSWKCDVQVYSDIEKEKLERIKIPDTFSYQYTNRNIINWNKNKSLNSFTKEAEKKENIIRCNCCEGGLMKKCWENKDCVCYQANKKLKELQNRNRDPAHSGTNFSTFDPIVVPPSDHFFDTIGFSCSEECSCSGRCTNNATFLLEKPIRQLEIYRKNEKMGFGIRTLTAIPVGTPVLEFTGELCGERLNSEDNDYSFAIISNEDNFYERTFSNPKNWAFTNWSKGFMERMTAQLRKVWFLNPKRKGNIARTCCHSCEPNLAMVRVFQKGFSPAHCRLLLVSQEVIFPGEELTFDYGPGYVEETLNTNCLCKRSMCKSSDSFDILKSYSVQSLQDWQIIKYHQRFRQFRENILKKISE